jgi:hypothetical protein
LNVSALRCDQGQALSRGAGFEGTVMESIRPEETNSIPLRAAPHRVGSIMLRFVGLLFLAVVALALVYAR